MIRVDEIGKRFGEIVAVDRVSFEAPDARITGLLGPNGAGKTTTLRMLSGLLRPDHGAMTIHDADGEQEIDIATDVERARAALGVLPDADGLYQRLTAREHLRYFGRLHGLGGEALTARIDQLIQQLDMGAIADRRSAGFSQGERMKVALARVLVHQPRHLLLDEPTNGLDVMSTRSVRELLRQLRDDGHAIIFSSHIMQEVAALCDHIVIIARGQVVAQGSHDDLRERAGVDDLEEAFVRLTGVEVSP
jgi:sodium transport system ATP-binding protein